MSQLFKKDPTTGEYYSSAAGDFTVTPTDSTKNVVLSDPGFVITPNKVKAAVLYQSAGGGSYTRIDIPIRTLTISGFTITFSNAPDFATGDVVEVYLEGPDKAKTVLDLIRSTDGIKKITDDVEVVQPDAANLKNTEANSATILARLTSMLATVLADESAFTAGSSLGNLMLGAATSDEVDSGEVGAVKINTLRELIIAGYAALSNAVRVEEIDPLDLKYIYEETELTNIASGTTGYIYFDLDGFKSMGIQTIISGAGTLEYTLEATIQNDGTASDSCTYQDVTTDLTGSASFTASDLHFLDTSLPIKYLRLKYVTTVDVTNLTVYSKKLY